MEKIQGNRLACMRIGCEKHGERIAISQHSSSLTLTGSEHILDLYKKMEDKVCLDGNGVNMFGFYIRIIEIN